MSADTLDLIIRRTRGSLQRPQTDYFPLKREGFRQETVTLFRHEPSICVKHRNHLKKATATEGSANYL